MDAVLLKLATKEISREQLLEFVEEDFGLLHQLLEGASSPKASIRYGCASVLVELCKKTPRSTLHSLWQLCCAAEQQAPNSEVERHGGYRQPNRSGC